jgi:hypothetical protein
MRPKFSKKDLLVTLEASVLKFEGMGVTVRKNFEQLKKERKTHPKFTLVW